MEIEEKLNQNKEKLILLKSSKFDEDKINTLIEIGIEQNNSLKSTYEYAKVSTEAQKKSLKLINDAINSYNETFIFIKKWLDAQNSRNDSVDREFTKIGELLEEIKGNFNSNME